MNTLYISNLTKTYKNGIKALDGISLTIENGMFGLLGPNGAGKSTLMRSIATLQKPDSGTINFNEVNVLEDGQTLRSQLGFLPQDFGVYPKLSAIKLLDHIAILKGIANKEQRSKQIEQLLHQTNLFEYRHQSAYSYSGGMLRRFGIAQALLGKPKLIIVDEPTAGLDPEERNRFLNLLSEIGENIIVVLSTHIVEDVQNLCPRMAILDRGKILLQGSPIKLAESLAGKIWEKQITKLELKNYEHKFQIISKKFIAGKPLIHIYAERDPDNGFKAIQPDLQDIYFTSLIGQSH